MANIQIYGNTQDARIHFDNSVVRSKPLNSVEAVAHPEQTNRVIVRSIVPRKNGRYPVFFRRLNINRLENKDGVELVSTLGMDRTQVLEYLNAEFGKTLAEIAGEYKGIWNATANTPDIAALSFNPGDWYFVTVAGTYDGVTYAVNDQIRYNGTSFNRIEDTGVKVADIENAALSEYDQYVDPDYVGTSTGSTLKPWTTVLEAVNNSDDNSSIFIKGINIIAGEITLPHGLSFYGAQHSEIKFASYSDGNGDIFFYDGDYSKTFEFFNIKFSNAGGYGLQIKKGLSMTIENCEFVNNGWNGTGLSTTLAEAGGVLGYDSSNTDLQAFYASANASNGGAMRIEGFPVLRVIGNNVSNNLRGIRVSDCGINGAGFVTRNVSTNNIESGIYLSVGSLGGCQNVTVTMNYSAYNANNGLLVIGGLNNKFSQNEVNGNWNAGFCAWGAGNTTLRDSGLYDNNRSTYNGIGNTGDAKASIQINEAYSLLGTSISINPAFRFIAEILDTQVHYTGLGSNTEKIGFLITSAVGALADNDKNIIKIDDVGFIGQDYAVDLSEVDVTNLRLSLGDNSYQSIGSKAVKAPLVGDYSELPFSNHVMQVPTLDIKVDTLKQMISLCEGIGGNVINTYKQNELVAVAVGAKVNILQSNSDKIQLRGLTFGNVYIDGVVTGTDTSSMVLNMNGAFTMNLVDYKTFLTSEVGINGDESEGGTLPAQAEAWYYSYGAAAGNLIPSSVVTSYNSSRQPFYNGNAIEQGREFIFTADSLGDFILGKWSGVEESTGHVNAFLGSNWETAIRFGVTNSKVYSVAGTDYDTRYPNKYDYTSSSIIAVRYGTDKHIYWLDVTGGNSVVIAKSNIPQTTESFMVQFAGFYSGNGNAAKLPIMQERTQTWSFVADQDSSEGGEWVDGLETNSVIKSNISIAPGFKVTIDLNSQGSNQGIGFGYTGTATGQNASRTLVTNHLVYQTSEVLRGGVAADWTWNTASANYVTTSGGGYHLGNGTPVGVISWRYGSDNSLEMWHEANNELMATKTAPLNGDPFSIYIGASGTMPNVPALQKFEIADVETLSNLQEWWYIESPDGTFFYPMFKTAAEAEAIDTKEGGSGTHHTHTFQDDPTGTTWYMNTTNSTHVGTQAPQGGVYGNSTNVIWNEQATGADAGFVPTFTNITYNVQEQSAVNIQYKPAGDTNTYNITGLPTGYADNGNSIIGTSENITNGYGQILVNTISVTKANDFGSASGIISINVLANLASHEFTIIDKEDGTIKFTQDGGLTELDFSTVTFAAGTAYKFYMDGTSIEAGDAISIVDGDGNTVSIGSVMNGSAGSAGAYLEYTIPADVAPGKFLRYYDLDTTANYTDVPLTLSGSSYTETVTGITNEGPGLVSGFDVAADNWYSIDEQLANGQRIVFKGPFFVDMFDAMQDGQTLCFGIKDGAWANTQDGNSSSSTGFENDQCIKFHRANSSGGNMKILQGGSVVTSLLIHIPSFLSGFVAFIELTANGDNIRMGFDYNDGNPDSTTYLDWSTNEKYQSGNQSYGFTNVDVMVFLDNASNTSDFGYDNIDWTALTEVSTPEPTAALLTPYTKGIVFDSVGSQTVQGYKNVNWNRLGRGTSATFYPNTDTTKNAVGTCYPYMMSIVFEVSTVTLGGSNYGKVRTAQMLDLRKANTGNNYKSKQWFIDGDGYMVWKMIDNSGDYVILTSTSPITTGDEWLGLYHDFSGATVGFQNSSTAERLEIYRFFQTDLTTGVVTRIPMTETWWGGSFNHAEADDDQMDATRGNGTHSEGSKTVNGMVGKITIASATTVLKYTSDIQATAGMEAYGYKTLPAEIGVLTRDPLQWEIDYQNGRMYRQPNFPTNVRGPYSASSPEQHYQAAHTAIFLYGDTSNASEAQDDINYIRNAADTTSTYFCDKPSAVSSPVYTNVSVTGLS